MEFRVTVSLGQDSVDTDVLDRRAAALQRCVPGRGQVLVDVVKAAIQLVLPVDADDAVDAAQRGTRIAAGALRESGLDRPTSIATVEAEAVAAPVTDLRPHPAS